MSAAQLCGLRYDMRAPEFGAPIADLYEAVLDQCEYADRHGFDYVRLNEHHGAEDGYLPSPLALAAAIAARTTRIRIRITVLLLALHDPLRVAEDAAVVDQIARGRLEIAAAAGYRSAEFAMFGRDRAARGRLVEEGVAALRKAWTGEAFEYEGRTVRVTPTPHRPGGVRLTLGGSSAAAARRAARIADGYEPSTHAFDDVYRHERQAVTGVDPGPIQQKFPLHFMLVTDDPEAAWEAIGRNLLHDMSSYAAWTAQEQHPATYVPVATLDELRSVGNYRIFTPEGCVEYCRSVAPAAIELQPLLGGMPPQTGWASLRLFTEQVKPALS